jgi:hypothetical protein
MMSALTSSLVVNYAFLGWEMEAGMKTMFLRGLALLVLASVLGFTLFSLSYERAVRGNSGRMRSDANPGPIAGAPPASEEDDVYSNPKMGISFQKPKSWEVFVDQGVVHIKPAAGAVTSVFLCPILRAHPKMTSLSFLRFVYELAIKQYPDLRLNDKRANSDGTLAEVSAIYTSNTEKVKGFYVVSLDRGRGLYCGYEDAAAKFDVRYTVLRNIWKSLRIAPADFYQAIKDGKIRAGGRVAPGGPGPTIDVSRLVTKAGVDGTMYVVVPPDWSVGGGNFVFVATAPDERMGVFTTNDHQPKTFDNAVYLIQQLLPFFQCQHTTISGSEPNTDMMKLNRMQGILSNAMNFYGETTDKNGFRIKFGIMVDAVDLRSAGAPGGYVTTLGCYAAPPLFDRNFNVLLAMALSITADQGKIMANLKKNLDRLGQASKTMSQTGDVVIQSLRQGAANADRAIDKYNYYLSGEEARYSPLENRIYVVDSDLANYAANPRYPQEMLTSVPDSLWNKLLHERNY